MKEINWKNSKQEHHLKANSKQKRCLELELINKSSGFPGIQLRVAIEEWHCGIFGMDSTVVIFRVEQVRSTQLVRQGPG